VIKCDKLVAEIPQVGRESSGNLKKKRAGSFFV
jgi:hypothetical protein